MGHAMRWQSAALGAGVGTALGGPLGGAAGFVAGGAMGSLISQWSGNGDYRVARNTLLSPKGTIPNFSLNSQSITVRHREFIGTIRGSSDFTVQYALPINPGLELTFPWLAPIASKFQQYEVRGMIFQYVPTSGTFSGSSSSLGAVMFQTTYRATDDNPVSKVELLNEYWSNETVASQACLHPIECSPKENPFQIHYVRNQDITSGEPLMYDLGKTFIATQGMDSDNIVGDIWCTYEIVLKKPLVASPVVAPNDYYFTASFTSGFTSVPPRVFFADPPSSTTGPPLVTFASGRTINIDTFVAYNYYIVVTIAASPNMSGPGVQWTGTPTILNGSAWNYDGVTSHKVSTFTGSSVSGPTLISQFGVTPSTTTTCSISLPDPAWTTGTIVYMSVVVTRV
jgi:hypothetical protein